MANGATHQLAGAVTGIAVCATDNPDRATGVHHPLAAGAAYLTHLALDALTSRSLPLVGKI